MSSIGKKPIAFLFPAFPVLHQTFVLWEVLALREQGVPIALYSLKLPSTRSQQPEGAALAREVTYLPRTLSGPVLWANVQMLVRHPGRYVGTFVGLVREWWHDRHVKSLWRDKSAPRDAAMRMLSLREWMQVLTNQHPLMYLLRSLWLVLPAVYLGRELQRAGIERVHAHWASYPTTVALVIRWIFGIRFSFTAHAYDIYLVPQLLSAKVRTAERVVTCARVNASYLEQVGGPACHERIIVNYHGVNLERFRPRPPARREGVPRLVTCGRTGPSFGPSTHRFARGLFHGYVSPVRFLSAARSGTRPQQNRGYSQKSDPMSGASPCRQTCQPVLRIVLPPA